MSCIRATAALFLACGMTLSACAQEPKPPSAVAIATDTPQPALPAAKLRSRMLALVDSLKTLEDTNARHVEQVMEMKLTPDSRPGGRSKLFGKFMEGGAYNLRILPRKDSEASNIEFRFYPDGEEEPHKSGTQVCSYDADALKKEVLARGYEPGGWPGPYGSEIWGFKKPDPTKSFVFVIEISVYRIVSETAREGRPCLRAFIIRHGELR